MSAALNLTYKKDYNHGVVSFDLVSESYKRLLQPNYGAKDVYKVILDVSRDCLCIFECRLTFIDVWLMKKYKNEESWTNLFCVPEEDLFVLHIPPVHYGFSRMTKC